MLEFEWDNTKAAANVRKHGVTFEQAVYAFRDPFGVERVDRSAGYGEEREILLGMSEGQILNVVYTVRGDRIRIISARRATKHEKDTYYRQNSA